MSKLMKTPAQNKAIFGLGAKLNCGHDDLRELARDVTNGRTDAISKLTFDEANGMIRRLGGRAFDPPGQFYSRRTENHRKQKAGIETIASAEAIEKMHKLWFAKEGRTADGLKSLCRRMLKDKSGNPLDKPRTAQQCSKVIEAIKAMNTRERLFKSETKKEAA